MLQKYLLTLGLVLSSLSIGLQAQDCAWTPAEVTASSGLILRKAPGKGFIKLIPQGDTVLYCADTTYGTLSYEGIDGFWRKLKYNGDIGYSFDGFLKVLVQGPPTDSLVQASKNLVRKSDSLLGDEQSASVNEKQSVHKKLKGDAFQFLVETYNYCGPVQEIDLQLYWYGVFLDDEINPTGVLEVRPLNLNISLSKNQTGGTMQFDVLTDEEERSLFLFAVSGSYPYQETRLEDVLPIIGSRGKRLFPGQEWVLDAESGLKLSATGSITKAGPCPEAENYTLKAILNQAGQTVEMDLKELISDYGSCYIPEIYWYGDLSGDGLPEIIFVSVQEEQNVFHFLRSEAQSSQLFTLQAVYTVENCATP